VDPPAIRREGILTSDAVNRLNEGGRICSLHTSGIRDWIGLRPLAGGIVDVVPLILRQRGLNFAPGEERPNHLKDAKTKRARKI